MNKNIRIVLAICVAILAYQYFSGYFIASKRCGEKSVNKLTLAFDIADIERSPLGSIALSAYRTKINQCYDLSS